MRRRVRQPPRPHLPAFPNRTTFAAPSGRQYPGGRARNLQQITLTGAISRCPPTGPSAREEIRLLRACGTSRVIRAWSGKKLAYLRPCRGLTALWDSVQGECAEYWREGNSTGGENDQLEEPEDGIRGPLPKNKLTDRFVSSSLDPNSRESENDASFLGTYLHVITGR